MRPPPISGKQVENICRRRFFFRPSAEIYGGSAGFYTYLNRGCKLKQKFEAAWRAHFVNEEDLLEIDATIMDTHEVLSASGHVERFNDFLVRDLVDPAQFFRADKLLEETLTQRIQECKDPQLIERMTQLVTQADGLSQAELGQAFQDYDIRAPLTGNALGEPEPCNLMFGTMIGPVGGRQGYLRPETAQGIFTNFQQCMEDNEGVFPFGVAQIGKVFRNEIAPRNGLTRVREFSQCEIEYFCRPGAKDFPKFVQVADLKLCLYSSDHQLTGAEPTLEMTLREAVAKGVICNQTLAYFLGRTYLFLLKVGIKEDKLRFRQHLPTEKAHYSSDCWDAEVWTSYGWLECVGHADRGSYDLTQHMNASGVDLRYKEVLDNPEEHENLILSKPSEAFVMKTFKKDGKKLVDHFNGLSDDQKLNLAESTSVQLDGQTFEVNQPLEFIRKLTKITTRAFVPEVIEPSFGVDRLLFSILEHVYRVREGEDKNVLSIPACITPYTCVILPLDQRITRNPRFDLMIADLRRDFSARQINFSIDKSTATIGKRYARNDEAGTAFAVTFDFESMEDEVPSVTLRERDSCEQERYYLSSLAEVVYDLVHGRASWPHSQFKFEKDG